MTRLATLLAVLLIAMSGQAHAQKKGLLGALLGAGATAARGASAPSSSSAPKTYDAKTLRPEALKACLVSAHDIDESEPKRAAEKKRLEGERAWLDKEEAALVASAKKPAESQADLERHKRRVEAWKKRLGAFNKAVDAYNAVLARDKSALAAFNADCAGKSYYSSDLAAIEKDLPFSTAGHVAKK